MNQGIHIIFFIIIIVDAMKKYLTACTMDCPDTCSLSVEVEEGKISKIGPSDLNPDTQGFICAKVSRFAKRVYAKERILQPLRRVGEKGAGAFQEITWDEAAAEISGKLTQIRAEYGGEAILPYYYGGSNGLLGQDTADRAFFAKLGASRLALTVCAAPTSEAARCMTGKMPGAPFSDYVHAKLILIWGANPKVSNIHLAPYLKEAKLRGAKIIAIDPVRNFSDNEIDMHVAIQPGTDVVLALALIQYWRENNLLNDDFIREQTKGIATLLQACNSYSVERAAQICQVPVDQITRLARLYAFHDPALLRIGWGLERNRNGGSAAAAVLALPAVLGKFGVPGSGYTLSNSGFYKVDGRECAASQPWNTRIINMNKLGKTLLHASEPPVKCLFVYNCNPAVTVPDQKAILAGLSRNDLFTVVSEQVMTDTAKFADIVLPATTFLEQEEMHNGYGSYGAHYIAPVIEPMGEALPNEQMFAFLGRQMGWRDKAFLETTEDYLKRAARSVQGFGKELQLDELKQKRIQKIDEQLIQFKNVFPFTPDRKINFSPQQYGVDFYGFKEVHDEKFPLALISPANNRTINSSLGEFNLPELFLTLNPRDAEFRSLEKGETIRVFNQLAEVIVRLKISDCVKPGVAILPKGAWRKAAINHLTSTALCDDSLSRIGKGATFNDARVEVEKYRESGKDD